MDKTTENSSKEVDNDSLKSFESNMSISSSSSTESVDSTDSESSLDSIASKEESTSRAVRARQVSVCVLIVVICYGGLAVMIYALRDSGNWNLRTVFKIQ